MFWQHVSDQSLVVRPHLIHSLLLIMNLNLPQEQLTRLALYLRQREKD